MQNSGIDFVSNETFDVVAVLNGTILEVKANETLGKIIEIYNNNYQQLMEDKIGQQLTTIINN